MERIDKYISTQTSYSRKDIKILIKNNRVSVNDKIINKSDIKINPELDIIKIDNEELTYKRYIYLVLNKPAGYVSATTDKSMKTVLDLVPDEYKHRNIFPVGRLDKDTTGLMILTDDGDFAHNILSPKKHVKKRYAVTIDIKVTEDMVTSFKNGVVLNDGVCQESLLEITGDNTAIVTLTEGKYHQIKRMFGLFNLGVNDLKRVSFAGLSLPQNLPEGGVYELSVNELKCIKNAKNRVE